MKSKRIIDIGAMTTKIAFREIENLTVKLFLSKEDKKQKDVETQKQIAEIIFVKLSHLKGTGLKLLQALALDEDLIPKPYIEKFEAAYGKVSPISRPLVKKVFKAEIGHSPEEVFAKFNYSPFAAASLGQVHEAVLKGGEAVVVKIQYPNVAENMQTDIKFIKTIVSAIGNPLIRSSVEELSQSLIAETDYKLEAGNIKFFNGLKTKPEIVIPKVYEEFSTSKVLTMSKVQGEPLNLVHSQGLKNQALQRVFDFFFLSLNSSSCIHADPHPGNFLINDSSTGIVDFGSVKRGISDDVKNLFLLLMEKESDLKIMVDLYEKLGADTSKGCERFYYDHVKEYHELCTNLLDSELVNFGLCKKSVAKMRRCLFFQSREIEMQNLSSEFTLLHKAFQSMLLMFCKYNALIQPQSRK